MSGAGPAAPDAAGADVADVAALYGTLNEYLLLEHKYQPRLCLPEESENAEVTAGARDGAAHVLRSLKVWYDLPCEVLIHAINLLDRFLTKMKVRPCHVPCITVSCMHLALDQYCRENNSPRTVAVEELVSISQSACTAGDVVRMSRVIADKLGCGPEPLTALRWLRLLRSVVAEAARELELPAVCAESSLANLLEIVSCDAACANARPPELALVLLYYKLEQQMVEWSSGGALPANAYYLFDLGAQLQAHCRLVDSSLSSVRGRVLAVLGRYEASAAQPQRQRLVWRLSTRTLKVLRPTERLTSRLPTIAERSPKPPPRNRSGSVSSEGETSDWPRSPLLPVYCGN